MPKTTSGTEIEEGRGDRLQRDQANQQSPNIVSLISQLADDNLRLLRNISTVLAVAGVVVISRSIRLITKFKSASEIPARFIEGNVSLRGKVHAIRAGGLQVEHVPIYLPVLSPLFSKHKRDADGSTTLMQVQLAGVELTSEGGIWLQKNLLPAQTVSLKLISREEDILHCLVFQSKQRRMWSYCMNEEVLRLGLARTAPIVGLLPDCRLYWRLHKRLHRAEVRAERKGLGLWEQESRWERASEAVRDSALFRLMRRIFRRG